MATTTTLVTDMAGADRQALPADMVSRFSMKEQEVLCDSRVIRPQRPPYKRSPLRAAADPNGKRLPLGTLARFPDELLLATLRFLDFQSLDRLRQVSRRARDLVEELEAFRELLSHASDLLHALHRTRLLGLHPAATIYAALRSSRCASCRLHFGGYLFLLTCERVCLSCLHENAALRVTTPDKAARCFGLSEADVDRLLPVMYSIPGKYFEGNKSWHRTPTRLVSVRHAKELSLALNGGVLPPPRAATPPTPPASSSSSLPRPASAPEPQIEPREATLFDVLRQAPLEPPGRDLSLSNPRAYLQDEYIGAAIFRIPFLRCSDDGVVLDEGRLCQGCHIMRIHHSQRTLPPRVMAQMVPPDLSDPSRVFDTAEQRLWATDEFPRHLAQCYGIQSLLQRG